MTDQTPTFKGTTAAKLDALARTISELDYMVSEAERFWKDRNEIEYKLAMGTADMLLTDVINLMRDTESAAIVPRPELKIVG